MTMLALIAGVWVGGVLLAWAFVAGACRVPSPEPFRGLDDLAELVRCA